jgi:serine/threonine-protein kinase RsbW
MVHADGAASRDRAAAESANVADRPERDSQRWCQQFRGEASELQRLRQWLTWLLPDRPARDDLLSVAVELGTNAIQHTASGHGGWFMVEMVCPGPARAADRHGPGGPDGPVVRVAVTDGGAESGPCLNEDPLSDCGRGLVIVHALSVRTGVSGDQRGRTVWAEVPWPSEPAAAPPSNGNGRSADGGRPEPEAVFSLLHDGGRKPRGQ